MAINSGPSLVIGLIFLLFVGCGILTGCSTSRNDATFAKSPWIWSIGIGMQLCISLACLSRLDFVAPRLEWASQPLTKLVESNQLMLFGTFILGSAFCAALCYTLRKLVVYFASTNSVLERQGDLRGAAVSGKVVSNSVASKIVAGTNSSLATYDYSKRDFVIFGTLLVFAAGFFAMLTYSTLYSFPWQSHWAKVPGVVTDVQSMGKTQRVDYSYTVAKKEITRYERFQFHGFLVHKGDAVVIRYDPGFPFRSKIQTGPTIATVVWGLCVIFLLVSAVDLFGRQPGPAVALKWKLY